MSATVIKYDFTADPPKIFECCDFCGDWHVELRLLDFDGWTANSNTCAACFGEFDGPSFTDLPLVQKAISHV